MRKIRSVHTSFEDDVPSAMLGVTNLADVMLVLAVGIMLALVINWNIDVSSSTGSASQAPSSEQMEEVEVSDQSIDLGSAEDIESNPDLEIRGTVYVDKTTGKMYMIDTD